MNSEVSLLKKKRIEQKKRRFPDEGASKNRFWAQDFDLGRATYNLHILPTEPLAFKANTAQNKPIFEMWIHEYIHKCTFYKIFVCKVLLCLSRMS